MYLFFCDYDSFIIARNFLVLCLTGSRDNVRFVYFNKEKPRLVLFAQINICGIKLKKAMSVMSKTPRNICGIKLKKRSFC